MIQLQHQQQYAYVNPPVMSYHGNDGSSSFEEELFGQCNEVVPSVEEDDEEEEEDVEEEGSCKNDGELEALTKDLKQALKVDVVYGTDHNHSDSGCHHSDTGCHHSDSSCHHSDTGCHHSDSGCLSDDSMENSLNKKEVGDTCSCAVVSESSDNLPQSDHDSSSSHTSSISCSSSSSEPSPNYEKPKRPIYIRKFANGTVHRLLRPIKDIPPRFQKMLVPPKPNPEKFEGQPLVKHSYPKKSAIVSANLDAPDSSHHTFNPNAPNFIPGQHYASCGGGVYSVGGDVYCPAGHHYQQLVHQEGAGPAAMGDAGHMVEDGCDTEGGGVVMGSEGAPTYTIHICNTGLPCASCGSSNTSGGGDGLSYPSHSLPHAGFIPVPPGSPSLNQPQQVPQPPPVPPPPQGTVYFNQNYPSTTSYQYAVAPPPNAAPPVMYTSPQPMPPPPPYPYQVAPPCGQYPA